MRSLLPCGQIAIRFSAEQSSSGMHLTTTRKRRCFSATATTGQGGTKERVVVIMGATGTGKSKLSIDLASSFPSEVVNADKMQVYAGLDVTTNKITQADRRGVPHHLLGDVDHSAGELTPAGFRSLAAAAISSITYRRRLPVVAGGSNSFIHALLADRYDPSHDPFAAKPAPAAVASTARLRYGCCLLWVDVAPAVLYEHLDRRVEEMLGAGMFEELAENYTPGRRRYAGLWRAIGVPEFDSYFERYPPGEQGGGRRNGREEAYEEAVAEIKENTRWLADRQVEKIQRLRAMGWRLRRVDATEAVRIGLEEAEGGYSRRRRRREAAWERDVLVPSVEAVKRFLEGKREEEEEEERGMQWGGSASVSLEMRRRRRSCGDF